VGLANGWLMEAAHARRLAMLLPMQTRCTGGLIPACLNR